MDHDKFSSMLKAHALFFCRSNKFKDPLEGNYTKGNVSIEDLWIAHQIANGGFGATPGSEADMRTGYRLMLSAAHQDRSTTFVNCWHMNEHESAKMWVDCAPSHDSVCIQSVSTFCNVYCRSNAFWAASATLIIRMTSLIR